MKHSFESLRWELLLWAFLGALFLAGGLLAKILWFVLIGSVMSAIWLLILIGDLRPSPARRAQESKRPSSSVGAEEEPLRR